MNRQKIVMVPRKYGMAIPPKICNGGYVREMKTPCAVCGAKPDEDCRARFSDRTKR